MIKALFLGLLLLVLVGCASRPVNKQVSSIDEGAGYRFETMHAKAEDQENLVVLAFSGGGTRAAAFSYGVLEFLRNTEMVGPKGKKMRLLDSVGLITGVSGGSFTALSYGLYGDTLFDEYEKRFLKRDVQGEIVSRVLNPGYWPSLSSNGWGRSELAAQLYDEILFEGATFADLAKRNGPFVVASATDISTGSRFVFNQRVFDTMCSDLGSVPLSRAAAASSAVPVVLSPVTLNNYGGSCNWHPPVWMRPFLDDGNVKRPAARATRSIRAENSLANSTKKPYVHLVDGGVSDNVGMRGVLDSLELMEALYDSGTSTSLDRVKRVIVFIVNSLSDPKTDWDERERPPDSLTVLLKAAGTPIDHYSYEAVELLKDTSARWSALRKIRDSAAMKANKDLAIAALMKVPNAEIYTIDVSFKQIKNEEERFYLNQQPTSFVLTDEAVDRLRASAGKIIMASPEFQRLIQDVGGKVRTAQ
jgi:NTE family protein